MQQRTFGVEEELLLVDPATGQAHPSSAEVVRLSRSSGVRSPGDAAPGEKDVVETELMREQVEIGSSPCSDLGDLRADLAKRRLVAAEAAEAAGLRLVATATSPLPSTPSITDDDRYRRLVDRFGLSGREQLSCGCHIHVSIASREEGVAVLDRLRPWLPVLLALSTNSPFWQGQDSGYLSYRSQVWGRFPTAGPTGVFGSVERYDETVRALVASGTVLDEAMVYFDARLSRSYPTVEVRVADVCLQPQDALLLAALSRALVETASRQWREGRPPPPVPTELLRVASWRAAATGITGDLVDVGSGARPVPAAELLGRLVQHAGPALQDAGDLDAVRDLLAEAGERGTGAQQQLAAYRSGGSLADVAAHAADLTVAGLR